MLTLPLCDTNEEPHDVVSISDSCIECEGLLNNVILGFSSYLPKCLNNEITDLLLVGLNTSIVAQRLGLHNVASKEDGPPKLSSCCTQKACLVSDEYCLNFDATFFRISHREANLMDPQQRLLLQQTWTCLETSDVKPSLIRDTNTCHFAGVCSIDYSSLLKNQGLMADIYGVIGTTPSILSGRVSYFYAIRGPAASIDTACSSSLVSLSLTANHTSKSVNTFGITSGTSVLLSSETFQAFSSFNMLSEDGHCKTFDASADGYVRGEGTVVTLIQSCDKSTPYLACILSSLMNQDGASGGITVPNRVSQEQLLADSYCHVDTNIHGSVFIQAHGTGTSLGDPIEFNALITTLSRFTKVTLGSIKSLLGHLEAAAGVCGFQSMNTQLFASITSNNLHFKVPNPKLSFTMKMITNIPSISESQSAQIAGTSSFGFSGTNVHTVVTLDTSSKADESLNTHNLLCLPMSAKTSLSLKNLINDITGNSDSMSFDPSSTLLCNRREVFSQFRCAVVSFLGKQLKSKLSELSYLPTLSVKNSKTVTAFLYSGHGSERINACKSLYQTNEIFRSHLTSSLQGSYFNSKHRVSLESVLYTNRLTKRERNDFHQSLNAHPIIFGIEVALTALLDKCDIKPSIVCGHSIGEIAAAAGADMINTKDGCTLTAVRGRLMTRESDSNCGMLVCISLPSLVAATICDFKEKERVSIAVKNTEKQVVLSGYGRKLKSTQEILSELDYQNRMLGLTSAAHTKFQTNVIVDLFNCCNEFSYNHGNVPLLSAMSGCVMMQLTCDYWCQQVLGSVNFTACNNRLQQLGITACLDTGPTPILLNFTKVKNCTPVSLLTSKLISVNSFGNGLGTLFCNGYNVQWCNFLNEYSLPNTITRKLPTYSFDMSQCWYDSTVRLHSGLLQIQAMKNEKCDESELYPLVGKQIRCSIENTILFETEVSQQNMHDVLLLLNDHKVFDSTVFPAAGYVDIICSFFQTNFWLNHPEILKIDDLVFLKKLVIEHFGSTILQTICTNIATRRSFRIMSLMRHNFEWTVNAKCSTSVITDISEKQRNIFDFTTDRFNKEHFYSSYSALGLNYGAKFQTVNSVIQTEGKLIAELMSEDKTSTYFAHPGLLDGVFQVIGKSLQHNTVCLPFCIDSVLAMHPLSHHCYCIVHLQDESNRCVVYDKKGNQLMKILNFRVRSIDISDTFEEVVDNSSKFLYFTSWQHQSAPLPPSVPAVTLCCVKYFLKDLLQQCNSANIDKAIQLWYHPLNIMNEKTGHNLVLLPQTGGVCNVQDISSIMCEVVQQLTRCTSSAAEICIITSQNSIPANFITTMLISYCNAILAENDALSITFCSLNDSLSCLPDLQSAQAPENKSTVCCFYNNVYFVKGYMPIGNTEKCTMQISGNYRFEMGITGNITSVPQHDMFVSDSKDFLYITVFSVCPDFNSVGDHEVVDISTLCGGCVGNVLFTGVKHYSTNQHVAGMAINCVASHIYTQQISAIFAKNSQAPQLETASCPLLYLTNFSSFIQRINIHQSKIIILHIASGGLTSSAQQILPNFGTTSYGIANTRHQGQYLHSKSMYHVGDSREPCFFTAWLNKAAHVLKCLNSNRSTLNTIFTLTKNSTFFEILKTGIWINSQVASASVALNYFTNYYTTTDAANTVGISLLSLSIVDHIYIPSVAKYYLSYGLNEAFLFMRSAVNGGKALISIYQPVVDTNCNRPIAVVSGGLGGIGGQVVIWLESVGITPLIVTRREQAMVGNQVKVADLSNKECFVQLLSNAKVSNTISYALHLAVHLWDTSAMSVTTTVFETVLAPKLLASWNIHTVTTNVKLSNMFLFSSLTSIHGNRGQCSYSAANAFLDQLSSYRHELGLPCTSINWGPWIGLGAAATVADDFKSVGVTPLNVDEGVNAFKQIFFSCWKQIIVNHYNFVDTLCETKTSSKISKRKPFPELHAGEVTIQTGQRVKATGPSYMHSKNDKLAKKNIQDMVEQSVKSILHLPSDAKIEVDEGFTEMGMDSMMLTELKTEIEKYTGNTSKLSSTVGFDYPTVSKLTAHLIDKTFISHNPLESVPLTSLSEIEVSHKAASRTVSVIGFSQHFPKSSHVQISDICLCAIDTSTEAHRLHFQNDIGNNSLLSNGHITKACLINNDLGEFDFRFFHISQREANLVDPQQRLLLQETWQCLEVAKIIPSSLQETDTCHFCGATIVDYVSLLEGYASMSPYLISSNGLCYLSGRVCYFYGFQGATATFDTACSSSLVALLTAESYLAERVDLIGIVSAANLILSLKAFIPFNNLGMLSTDGHIKPFDNDADGTVRSEGISVCALTSTTQDTRHFEIAKVSVNHGGSSSSFTTPNRNALEALMLKFESTSMNDKNSVIVQMHATGSPIGDSIEFNAAASVFSKTLVACAPKSIIGHMEPTSGLCSITMSFTQLHIQVVPGNQHFKLCNSKLDIKQTSTVFPIIPFSTAAIYGRVTAFGLSGTNAHAVLKLSSSESQVATTTVNPVNCCPLSAHSMKSVKAILHKLLNNNFNTDYSEIISVMSHDRECFSKYRVSICSHGTRYVKEIIQDILRAKLSVKTVTENRNVFLYTGHNVRKFNTTMSLPILNSKFAEEVVDILQSCSAHQKHSTVVTTNNSDEQYYLSMYPYMFAIRTGLTHLLERCSILPDVACGLGVGEINAAAAAKIVGSKSSCSLMSTESRLLSEASKNGSSLLTCMASISFPYTVQMLKCLANISVTMTHKEDNVVLTGKKKCIQNVWDIFKEMSIDSGHTDTSVTHMKYVSKAVLELFSCCNEIDHAIGEIPFVSGMNGVLLTMISPEYWCQQLFSPTDCSACFYSLTKSSISTYINTGPDESALSFINGDTASKMTLLSEKQDIKYSFISALANLFSAGYKVNWLEMFHKTTISYACFKQIPTYTFDVSLCWFTLDEQIYQLLPQQQIAVDPTNKHSSSKHSKGLDQALKQDATIDNIVKSCVKSVLGITDELLEMHTVLPLMGADSMMMVDLKSQLLYCFARNEEEQGLLAPMLPSSVLFYEMTVESLIKWMSEVINKLSLLAFGKHDIALNEQVSQNSTEGSYITNKLTALRASYDIDKLPMGESQGQMFLFWKQFSPWATAPIYNVALVYATARNVSLKASTEAFQNMLMKHFVMRTAYVEKSITLGNASPAIQYLLPMTNCFFLIKACCLRSSYSVGEVVLQLRQRPIFDLRKQRPHFKSILFETNERYYFTPVLHHSISDGWGVMLYTKEFKKAIQYDSNTEKLPIQYIDYVFLMQEYIQSQQSVQLRDYWKNHMSGYEGAQFIHDSPLVQFKVANYIQPNINLKSIKSYSWYMAKVLHMTPLVMLLTNVFLILHQFTNQSDIVIGCAASNRTTFPHLTKIIGCFLSHLPIRLNGIDKLPSMTEMMIAARDVIINCYKHQEIPGRWLVEDSIKATGTGGGDVQKLYNTYFNYLGDLEVLEDFSVQDGNNEWYLTTFDLELRCKGSERKAHFVAVFQSNPRKFYYATVRRIAQCFDYNLSCVNRQLVRESCLRERANRFPQQSGSVFRKTLMNLDELSFSHRDILSACKTQANYTAPLSADTALHEKVTTLSFTDVFDTVRVMAAGLKREILQLSCSNALGVGAFQFEKQNIYGRLGLLSLTATGSAFAPIASTEAQSRKEFLIKNMNCAICLHNSTTNSDLAYDHSQVVGCSVTRSIPNIQHQRWKNNTLNNDVDLFYVFHTSGTTGTPKGVCISHQNVMAYCAMVTERINPVAAITFTSPTFDPFVDELVTPLLNSGKQIILKEKLDMKKELNHIPLMGHLNTTPTVLQLLLRERNISRNVEHIALGGEVLKFNFLSQLCNNKTTLDATIWNAYGPTETTINVTLYRTQLYDIPDSIGGSAIPHGMHVTNSKSSQIRPSLFPAECVVSGPTVAMGYLCNTSSQCSGSANAFTSWKGKFEEQNKRINLRCYHTGDFIKCAPNGSFVFIGRQDKQIKIRGVRIELEEIENVISSASPNIKQSGVIVHQIDGNEFSAQLIGFIATNDDNFNVGSLKGTLYNKLPMHMVPSRIIVLNKLPMTSSDKIDRNALATMVPDITMHDEVITDLSPLQIKIIDCWKEVLRLDKIGLNDNFFQIGGNSMLIILLANKLSNSCKIPVHAYDLFKYQTIEALTWFVESAGMTNQDSKVSNIVSIKQETLDTHPNTAIICVHGIFSALVTYRVLAENIPWHGQVNVIEHATYLTQDRLEALDSSNFESIIADYITQLAHHNLIQGKHILIGQSAAGIVCQQLISQMKKLTQNKDAAQIPILVDSPAALSSYYATDSYVERMRATANVMISGGMFKSLTSETLDQTWLDELVNRAADVAKLLAGWETRKLAIQQFHFVTAETSLTNHETELEETYLKDWYDKFSRPICWEKAPGNHFVMLDQHHCEKVGKKIAAIVSEFSLY